jgi:3,4-dihydroxy-2-butanone 4-phosphate synthase
LPFFVNRRSTLSEPTSPVAPSQSTRTTNSGYICIALPGETLERLSIPMMVTNNEETNKTAYTVTVDYKHG